MNTQTDPLKAQFIDYFNAHEGYPEGDFEIDADKQDCAVTDDDTIMFCRESVSSWGIMDFTMGYTEYDDERHSVYVFRTGSSWAAAKQLVINADKVEAVADLLDKTPAEVADSVQTYRTYPAKINTDCGGTILIAPVANASGIEYDD